MHKKLLPKELRSMNGSDVLSKLCHIDIIAKHKTVEQRLVKQWLQRAQMARIGSLHMLRQLYFKGIITILCLQKQVYFLTVGSTQMIQEHIRLYLFDLLVHLRNDKTLKLIAVRH